MRPYNVEAFEEYPVPTAEAFTNYTKATTAELQKIVCIEKSEVFDVMSLSDTDPYLSEWFPEKLTFEHLEPKDTVFRQACSINDEEIEYVHFMMRNGVPVIVNSTNELFNSMASEEQALEYLAYFSIAHKSTDSRFIIGSEQQFDSATTGCDIERIPAFKDIRVAEENRYYSIEVNVFDRKTGGIYHEDWQVPYDTADGDARPVSSSKLGQCPEIE